MTLQDLYRAASSRTAAPPKMIVFYDREQAESYMSGGREYEMVAVIQTDFMTELTMSEDLYKLPVYCVFAWKKDIFVVVIDGWD